MSFACRQQRTVFTKNVAQANSANVLEGITWRECELSMGEAFKLQDYSVTQNGAGRMAVELNLR